ncbi:MAG: hypothetical protein NC177_15440 [Ruminococcus flavefaciens]|nr:hypothetical protein [Ruminococcus flavefaciens]
MNNIQLISECKNETVSELADILGLENTCKLIDKFGGSQLYIPQMERICREYRNHDIYGDFLSGMNYRDLTNKYSMSEMALRKIVKAETEKRKSLRT